MSQQYVSADWYSTDYFSVDWWLPANSANVNGIIAATLDDFGAGNSGLYFSKDWFSFDWFSQDWFGGKESWVGSFFVPAGFNATMPAQMSNFSAAFVGSAIQNDIFDISTSIGVNWTDYQVTAANGTIGVTLDNFTISALGTAGNVGGVSGAIAQTMQNFSPAITGTATAPPNETGTIAVTLQDFSSTMVGQSLAVNARTGIIGPTLDDFGATMTGTADVPHYSGTINPALDNFTTLVSGLLFPAGTHLGVVAGTMDDFALAAQGTASFESVTIDSVPGRIEIRAMRVGDISKHSRIGSKRKRRA